MGLKLFFNVSGKKYLIAIMAHAPYLHDEIELGNIAHCPLTLYFSEYGAMRHIRMTKN